ncbi:DUF433 domain-containing protein [Polyangium sorediatum]|uniref:DUF433 domain-containing protein n=1 Tax=Polyangium sorediatum TaxID=889274 RepID=A0ABT6P7L2_9BACT|nr:DUF433 domain-containing protein [Polyangium sorediatum]MDI1436609.1 DUF433 domain-containing protein [Polyangium sorediatum]
MADASLPRVRVPHPHVRCDARILAGSPHVEGSRVPVRRLWVWHRGGASVETLLRRYPNLGPARILDALSFAYDNQDLIDADLAREQALFEKQGGPSVGARPLSQLPLPFDEAAPDSATARALARQPMLPGMSPALAPLSPAVSAPTKPVASTTKPARKR